MKRVILSLAAVLAIPISAQAGTYTLPVHFSPGDHLRQTVVQTIDLTETGQPRQVMTTHRSYMSRFEAHEDGFQIHKVLDHFDMTPKGSALPSNPLATAHGMLLAPDVQAIDYLAGPTLYPREVLDWDRVKADIRVRLRIANGSESQTMLDMLDSRSGALLFFKADALLYYARGATLELNKPVRTESAFNAPIGGGQVKAITTLTLASWDEQAGLALIDYDFVPDQTSMSAYIRTLLPQFLGEKFSPDKIESAANSVQMDNSTHCRYEMAIATGLVNAAHCEMRMVLKVLDYSQNRIESFDMTEARVP